MFKTKYLIFLLSLGLAGLIASEASPGKTKAPSSAIEGLFPPSAWLQNWKWEDGPSFFQPDNLFDYINGSAELYLAYGFQRLATINIVHSEDKSVIIDIYDMGTPLNAFGVYSSYRSAESSTLSIGAEAITAPAYIRFYQDRYVVDLNGSDTSSVTSNAMDKMAREISNRIGKTASPPAILALLPRKGLVKKTEKYIAESMLGYNFLPRGLEASYLIEGTEVKAFIVITRSPAESASALSAFQRNIEKQGKLLRVFTIDKAPALSAVVPYHQQSLVARSGNYLCGILDLPQAEKGMILLTDMLKSVAAFSAY